MHCPELVAGDGLVDLLDPRVGPADSPYPWTVNQPARDASDLSEFVKRLRSSARFERISHPEFRVEVVRSASSTRGTARDQEESYYSFELTAQVRYWD